MKKTVIIVAGGKGERMQANIPKQFIETRNKVILMHTIEAFERYDKSIAIIVVLPISQISYWTELCIKHNFSIQHQIAEGGETRFHSVKNGLDLADSDSLIAVHDGVRPMVSCETISRCFLHAEKQKAVVPVIDINDSIRYSDKEENHACNRAMYKLVQTPQVFDGELLKKSYEQAFSPLFTDDASVVEALGTRIHLVEGNRENIKITTPFDLKLLEVIGKSNLEV